MNKVFLIGNICREVELKTSNTGTLFISNAIAVQRTTKDVNGNYESDFFNFIAFKNQADYIYKYCPKGAKIVIEGTLRTNQYQDRMGEKRVSYSIWVNSVELLKTSNNQDTNIKEEKPKIMKPQQQNYDNFDYDIDDEDLPF